MQTQADAHLDSIDFFLIHITNKDFLAKSGDTGVFRAHKNFYSFVI